VVEAGRWAKNSTTLARSLLYGWSVQRYRARSRELGANRPPRRPIIYRPVGDDTRGGDSSEFRSGDNWWCSVFDPRMVGVYFGVCYRLFDDAACAMRNGQSPFRCQELAHGWCIVEMRGVYNGAIISTLPWCVLNRTT
jgi:hypothetical protein